MSFIDIVLGLLLLYGLIKGVKNGLVIEIASILALVAGLYGAIHFSYIVGNYLASHWDWNERTMSLVSFIITFFIIVIAVITAAKLLTKIAEFAMLGLLNKIAGGLFGALKVAIILGALLIFLESVNKSLRLVNEDTKSESVLYEPIRNIGELVFSAVIEKDDDEDESAQ
ncbi:MAG: CvpA family protein [Flavobacteriaceae bacterium]|nr:CvpA family protein [Muriicola sp.]NNC61762.1 CvpA family protein [Eudoraea sp.]NNK20207.1 CvpA family protein [Flavobacteriaceae bacterium]MBT8290762.1 CvpA family protein [Muriicola sp.]NNK35961.1 CvpA family protein [Eudoraea sp.]